MFQSLNIRCIFRILHHHNSAALTLFLPTWMVSAKTLAETLRTDYKLVTVNKALGRSQSQEQPRGERVFLYILS